MVSTSIPGGSDPMGLFRNFSEFRSMTQSEEETLESFASRVTRQSLLIETFCDEDRILQARNQVLVGMKSQKVREEALGNGWTLEDLIAERKLEEGEGEEEDEEEEEESVVKSEVTDFDRNGEDFEDDEEEEEDYGIEEEEEEEDEDEEDEEESDQDHQEDEEEDEEDKKMNIILSGRIKEEVLDFEDFPSLNFGDEDESKALLKKHLKKEERYSCEDCQVRFASETARDEHRKAEYKCEDCSEVLRCLKIFRKHVVDAHGRYYCHSCNTYYKSASTLKNHRGDHHSRKSRPRQCEYCSQTFPTRMSMRTHLEKACRDCRFCASTRVAAAQHMMEVHQGRLKNQCPICNKVLCGSYALKIHTKTMHEPESHIYKCDICPRKFALERLLKNHVLRVHLKRRMFKCEKCFKGFNSPKELQRHIDGVHEKKIASICHICSKVFYHENGLRWHVERVHDRIKNQKCNSCDMAFYNRSELVKHVKAIHEKTLDFKCEYCGRLFNRKSVMVQHIKSLHTFEKNYKCDICGNTYVSKYHMTRHVKEAHEHFTRDCDICHKPFAGYGSGNLKKHKRTVHGVK